MWQDTLPGDRRESGIVREVKVATLSQNALQAATATKNKIQSISNPNPSTTVDDNPEHVLIRQSQRHLVTVPISATNQTTRPSQIFEAATNEYKNLTEQDLLTHPFSIALDNFKTPDAIVDVFRKQAQVFEKVSKDNEKLMGFLSPIVEILFTLSVTIGEIPVSLSSLLLYVKDSEVRHVIFSETISRKGDLYRHWYSSGG